MAVSDDESAVLLIRVWLEEGNAALRARLTAVSPLRDGTPVQEATVAVAASPEEVVAAVEEWLADFLRRGDTPLGS